MPRALRLELAVGERAQAGVSTGLVDNGGPVPENKGGTVQKVANSQRDLHRNPLKDNKWTVVLVRRVH